MSQRIRTGGIDRTPWKDADLLHHLYHCVTATEGVEQTMLDMFA